jgi:dienelactone hydrolase
MSGSPSPECGKSELVLSSRNIDVPLDALSTVRTNAFVAAPPLGEPRELPLVVLSPGPRIGTAPSRAPRATLTSIGEDLASHGYVVVVIDHTHENSAMTFPDGRLVSLTSRQSRIGPPGQRGRDFSRRLKTGRAADVSFVLDELLGPNPPRAGAALIDPARIGMAGHSAGGASTIAAMLADQRIRAGSDVDGSTDAPIPELGLSRPFLFFGRDGQYSPGDSRAADTWARDWPGLTGWKRWLVVAGAAHASFTDLGLFADQLGIEIDASAPGSRITAVTRTYLCRQKKDRASTNTCATNRARCSTARTRLIPKSASAHRRVPDRDPAIRRAPRSPFSRRSDPVPRAARPPRRSGRRRSGRSGMCPDWPCRLPH